MSRLRRSSDDSGDQAIDISPLIDCVFILLIFFIVTTTFVEEKGIEAEKSSPGEPMQSDGDSLIFSLSADGKISVGNVGVEISGVQPRVQTLLRDEGADAPVIVQAHDKTPAAVLVRVIDEAKLAGAATVSLGATKSN